MKPASSGDRRPVLLAALAAWAVAVPWLARAVGLPLDVATRLEVVDHVVPGLLVLVCCGLLLHPRTGGSSGSLPRLAMIGIGVLAGLWITATHAPLLPEAIDGASPWGPALIHLSAGPPVTVAALWMLLTDSGPLTPSL